MRDFALDLGLLRPPPSMSVSKWADTYRVLSQEDSAEPGPWRTSRTPYLRGIMDAFTDDDVETIVVKTSSQVGKTAALGNMLGRLIHLDPGPTLMVQPTVALARAWSTERFAAQVRDCAPLRERISDPRSRDGTNSTLSKSFPGGSLAVTGSNAPSALASRPVRYLLLDEVDRYPISVGTEGDPVGLAVRRTATFVGSRRIVMVSTPTIDGMSRIEQAYRDTDQQCYFVPCPECDGMQRLLPAGLVWPDGKPEHAAYACQLCGVLIDHRHQASMLAAGEWRPTRTTDEGPAAPGHRGFWLNGLYSPWLTWGAFADEWERAKASPESLQAFTNTAMAELWMEGGGRLQAEVLAERVEDYVDPPVEVVLLTATVDVQSDRLEVLVKGWGADGEGWSIEHHVIDGDPARADVWRQLTEYRAQMWTRADGHRLGIEATLIDEGGHHTTEVRTYCMGKRRCWPIKGAGGQRPITARPSRTNMQRVPVWTIGVDAAKTRLWQRLQLVDHGAGYQHYGRGFDAEWFAQLAAEKMVRVRRRGLQVISWQKVRDRNEAWDLEVYQIAAAEIMAKVLRGRLPSSRTAAAEQPADQQSQIGSERRSSETGKPVPVPRPVDAVTAAADRREKLDERRRRGVQTRRGRGTWMKSWRR